MKPQDPSVTRAARLVGEALRAEQLRLVTLGREHDNQLIPSHLLGANGQPSPFLIIADVLGRAAARIEDGEQ